MMLNSRRWLMTLTLLMTGCVNIPPTHNPDFAPVMPTDLQPPPNYSGSIYQANRDVRLFEDNSARRVGDILTVLLQENHNANKQADTEIDKSTNTRVTAPMLFGAPAASLFGFDLESELSTQHQFEGETESQQSNRLSGNISVTVVKVYANGNLFVRGEKRMSMNQGDEYIRLSGLVRPADIATDNTVPSTKLADATIQYVGDGALDDANRMGWLARFFISPWFPF
ncbi:MAG: flagellar basal body L-ring protein FlgH [Methylococcales bacterium]|nr:flagellar basal body L-ring protein FlgH [Methylococcales bacterium]